jgi:hypothetical protein
MMTDRKTKGGYASGEMLASDLQVPEALFRPGAGAPTNAAEDGALLAAATRFSFGDVGSRNPHEQIDVEVRRNAFEPGAVRWIVTCAGWTHTHDGGWLYEDIPGERTEEYADATRWDDRDEAVAVARRLVADGHPNTAAWMRGRRR